MSVACTFVWMSLSESPRACLQSPRWELYIANQKANAARCLELSECHTIALWAWSGNLNASGHVKWPPGSPSPPPTAYSSNRHAAIDTEFEMEYGTHDPSIPLNLYMTLKDKVRVPQKVQGYIDEWEKVGFQVKLFDDGDMDSLLATHLPELAEAGGLKKINVATRSDIFRYLVVWLNGGFYGDIDVAPVTPAPASQWPIHNTSFVTCPESWLSNPNPWQRPGVQWMQYFFGAVARHPVLRNLLDSLVERRHELWTSKGNVEQYGLGAAG